MMPDGHSAAVTYGTPAWDVRWRKSIAYAMNELTEVFWRGRENQRAWFAFGGCLFWLLLWWAAFIYFAAKFAVWAAAEVTLLVALLGVLAAGVAWRQAPAPHCGPGHGTPHGAGGTPVPVTATDRDCVTCGRRFRGYKSRCAACMATVRQCVTCNATFTGRYLKCPDCRPIRRRTCTACDRMYCGTQLLCPACRLADRDCVICGSRFRGLYRKCSACRYPEHPCVTCGHVFRSSNSKCQTCRRADRKCITCGRIHGRLTLECDSCSGRSRAADNARRARELAAQVTGPLPRSVYVEVLTSGPCAYCGAPATAVDHVRPLTEGGHEARYNLAPACRTCNSSKGGKLLICWDPVRVAHGVAHSPAVAAELDRETMAMC